MSRKKLHEDGGDVKRGRHSAEPASKQMNNHLTTPSKCGFRSERARCPTIPPALDLSCGRTEDKSVHPLTSREERSKEDLRKNISTPHISTPNLSRSRFPMKTLPQLFNVLTTKKGSVIDLPVNEHST